MTDTALAAAPIIGNKPNLVHLSGNAAPSASWEAARDAYIKADKAVNDYDRDHLTPASARYMAWRDQWPTGANMDNCPEMKAGYAAASAPYDLVSDQFDQLVYQKTDALKAMIAQPAPDCRAASFKVETFISDESWQRVGFDEMMSHLLTDLRRLGANA